MRLRVRLGVAAVVTAMIAGGLTVAACSSSSGPASSADSGGADSRADGFVPEGGALDAESGTVCPSGRGPSMVSIPAADGGSYCIDSTEVTYDQYRAFLTATNGDTSKQPSYCSWNTSFAIGDAGSGPGSIPCSYPDGGDHPVACVDWCDAYAFCAWAGKRLCNDMRNLDAGMTPDAALADPVNDEWVRACSAAGEYAFPYGNTYQSGTCADLSVEADAMAEQTLPVATLKRCQSVSPAYAGVFDLVGNVSEWTSGSCNAPGDPAQMCSVLGTSIVDGPGTLVTGPIGCNPDSDFEMAAGAYAGSKSPVIGFRCCADP